MKKTSPKSVYIVSLGCPKNFVDTEIIAASLIKNGFGITPSPDDAEIYLINTCAFIPAARKETTDNIKDAVKWKKKSKNTRKIVISGCISEWDKSGDFRKDFPEVDLWKTPSQAEQTGIALAALFGMASAPSDASDKDYIYDHCTARLQLTLPHYAYIKIADGCDNCCTYCSIPSIRGRMRSRKSESVLKEAQSLIKSGVKELIIIAQDITSFGLDRKNDKDSLAKLLRKMDELEGDFSIRLLYTHPAHFTQELVDCFRDLKHLLPYADMPLQHISDKILHAMNRKITKAEICKLIEALRKARPEIALRTTFITGFPGETEENYKELLNFVKEYKFARLGVFEYSPEPGTPAAQMPDQVPAETARKRSISIMKAQEKFQQSSTPHSSAKNWN